MLTTDPPAPPASPAWSRPPQQPLHLRVDAAAPLGQRRAMGAASVEVQMHAVLGGLGLGDPLDVPARAAVVGIDGAGVVPALSGDALVARPVPPAPIAGGWVLQLVADRLGPEPRQRVRVGPVQDHLDPGCQQLSPCSRGRTAGQGTAALPRRALPRSHHQRGCQRPPTTTQLGPSAPPGRGRGVEPLTFPVRESAAWWWRPAAEGRFWLVS
jgi:hypothetical protein